MSSECDREINDSEINDSDKNNKNNKNNNNSDKMSITYLVTDIRLYYTLGTGHYFLDTERRHCSELGCYKCACVFAFHRRT